MNQDCEKIFTLAYTPSRGYFQTSNYNILTVDPLTDKSDKFQKKGLSVKGETLLL